jgi:hypothetical protein
MKIKFLSLAALFVACSVNAQEVINTAYGEFKINSDLHYQTYMLNDKVIGSSEFLGVDGKFLGMSSTANYLVLRGSTGGSACAEVLSIVKVSQNEVVFSPALDACGGVENIDFNKGIVTITAFERDEKTEVKYVIENGRIQENGKSMLVKHNFVETK